MVGVLEISDVYFPPFGKADCTTFALLVGRSVGQSVGIPINFPTTMIIWMDWPLANDHLDGLASYK